MTTELDSAALRQRAKRGVVFLAVRAVAVQAITLFGNIALARQLTASEFGVFGVVQFVLSLFTLMGDVGLGAALIQRAETPTRDELSSVFWLQTGIGVLVFAVIWGVSPWVIGFWPDLPAESLDLLRVLAVSFIFVMVRAVPCVLLERELSFGKMAVLELLLTCGFYATATTLAYQGCGARSLMWAVMVQAALGVAISFILSRWRPHLVFRASFVRSILAYGVAYQSKTLVGFANGGLIPLVGGRVLGTVAVGHLTWAQSAANQPMRIVALLARVSFPLLSREGNSGERRRVVERTLQLSAMAVFAFEAVCFGLGEHVVRLVYGERWLPALPIFYVLVASMSVGFLAPIVTSALEAMGKPRLTAGLSLAWVILNWACVCLTMLVQPTELAFAIAFSVHVVVGNVAVLIVLHKELPGVALARVFVTSVAAAGLAALMGRAIAPGGDSLFRVLLALLATVGGYALIVSASNFRLVRGLLDTARR